LVKVSREIKKQMVEMKLFESDKGRIKGLTVSSQNKNSNGKSYYVEDSIYKNYLRRTKKNNFTKG